MKAPAFGDIIMIDWSPSSGREMRDPHPGLVVSATPFNRQFFCLVCPITSTVRGWPFEVKLAGAGLATGGVILADRPASLDLKARRWRAVERAPGFIVDDVMAKLVTLFPGFTLEEG